MNADLERLVTATGYHAGFELYQVDPGLLQRARAVRGLSGLLQLTAWCMTMSDLAAEGVGANRQTADAVGSTLGLTGSLIEYRRLLGARAGLNMAASATPWACRATSALGYAGAGIGAGVSLWQAMDNLAEDDVDTAVCHTIAAVGSIMMMSPHPGVVVAGLALLVGATIGAQMADDNELDQWAHHGPYGTGRDSLKQAVFAIQRWCLAHLTVLRVHVTDRGHDGLTISVEGRGVSPRTIVAIDARDGSGWTGTFWVNLAAPTPPAAVTVTRRPQQPEGALSLRARIDPANRRVGSNYHLEGQVRLLSPEAARDGEDPFPYHSSEFEYEFRVPEVTPGGPTDLDRGRLR